MILRIREKTLDFSNRTMVMGIININDDSFSGDGTLDQYKAMQMALEKVDQGADIIDVGAIEVVLPAGFGVAGIAS